MVNYRRSLLAGGSYFFTLNLADRRLRLLPDRIDLLRAAFRYVRTRHPFTVDAIVVLPDHLHAIFSLPDGDADYALRLRFIKTHFSRHTPPGEHRSASRMAKTERGIWQRRYSERHDGYLHPTYFTPHRFGYNRNRNGFNCKQIVRF